MQAILYIGHGTRLKQGVDEVIEFVEETKKHLHIPIQETAFLELVEPSILEGIKNCVEKGATHIVIAPILLLEAGHAKVDIPEKIEKAKIIYPNIHFSICKPLGFHENLIEEIFNKINASKSPISKDEEVVLIARGSSDKSVIQVMKQIAKRFKEKYHFQKVHDCYLYGAGTSLNDLLEDIKIRQPKKVYFVPYLLFSGLLNNSIPKKIDSFGINQSEIIKCESLGCGENVRQVFLERILEVLLEVEVTT